jgi:hypothetical protein
MRKTQHWKEDPMLTMTHRALGLTLALCLMGTPLLTLTGCERKEGPAEELGEQVDDAIDDAGDAVDDATD